MSATANAWSRLFVSLQNSRHIFYIIELLECNVSAVRRNIIASDLVFEVSGNATE